MFRPTESGYTEFKQNLVRRVVKSLVTGTPNPVSPGELDDEQIRSVTGLDLSDLYWDRIPRSHYYTIAKFAADDEFYVPDNVEFTQPAEDVLEQIAFAAIIEDVRDEFTAADGTDARLIEKTQRVLELHDRLDTLLNDQIFSTPSAIVNDFETWVADHDDYGFGRFNEAHVRRDEPINPRHDHVVDAVDAWTTDRLPDME